MNKNIMEDCMVRRFSKILNALWLAAFLLPLSIITSAVFAQEPRPDSTDAQRETVRSIHERFGNVRVYVDRDGAITAMQRILIDSLSAENAVDKIYQMLEQNADVLGIVSPRQELVITSNDNSTIEMQQMVGDVKVYLGGLVFNLSLDKSYIFGVGWRYYPEARSISTTPTIDSLQAAQIAQDDPAHGDAETYACCYELFISSTYDGVHQFATGGMHLVWKLTVGGGGYQGDALYMIDAHSGQILDVRCGSRF